MLSLAVESTGVPDDRWLQPLYMVTCLCIFHLVWETEKTVLLPETG